MPISDANAVNTNSNPGQVKQQLVFMDGFNRPYQSVTRNVATVNGQQKHVVQLFDNGTHADRYSFLPYASTDGNLQPQAFLRQRDYYASQYPNEGYTAFSKSANTSTNDLRTVTSYAPGKSQVGQLHGTVSQVITNGAAEVRFWSLDARGLPESKDFYAANELFGTETIAPSALNGDNSVASPRTKVFTDRDGKMILKMVADSIYNHNEGFSSSKKNTFQCTYYVYDKKGNLHYVIPPLAYASFEKYGTLLETTVKNLCFHNTYDRKGRMTGTQNPGEDGITWAVYDRKNRMVMRQTPNETATSEWEIVFYDQRNRVKATSVYKDDEGRNQAQWQTLIDNSRNVIDPNSLLYYLSNAEGEKIYPFSGSPFDLNSIIYNNTMMGYNWYDNTDHLESITGVNMDDWIFTKLNITELNYISPFEWPSKRIDGMLTGSMVRVLRSPNALPEHVGDWRVSQYYYDDKGRGIYNVSFTDDETSGAEQFNFDYAAMKYDFAGRLLITKHVMWKHNTAILADNPTLHAELTKYEYDGISGSLTKVSHKVDNLPWATLSKITYDDFGRIKRKDLGGGSEVQDYSYNIRGS